MTNPNRSYSDDAYESIVDEIEADELVNLTVGGLHQVIIGNVVPGTSPPLHDFSKKLEIIEQPKPTWDE